MEIVQQKFLDAGPQNENGEYEYYYSGNNYLLKEKSRGLIARIYDDTPDHCSFVAWLENEQILPISAGIPYSDLFFCRAVKYMLDEYGVATFELLTSRESGAYETIDLATVMQILERA